MTIKSQQARGGSETLIGFLKNLLIFGGVWFLCFPMLVFSAGFFWHYQRHRIVAGGVLLTQTFCLGAYSTAQCSKVLRACRRADTCVGLRANDLSVSPMHATGACACRHAVTAISGGNEYLLAALHSVGKRAAARAGWRGQGGEGCQRLSCARGLQASTQMPRTVFAGSYHSSNSLSFLWDCVRQCATSSASTKTARARCSLHYYTKHILTCPETTSACSVSRYQATKLSRNGAWSNIVAPFTSGFVSIIRSARDCSRRAPAAQSRCSRWGVPTATFALDDRRYSACSASCSTKVALGQLRPRRGRQTTWR